MAGMTLPEATWVGRARTFAFFALALVVVASIGVLAAKPAHASTITVTTTDDSGAGSLRQGIEDANSPANSGADTIEFNIPATDTGCNATSGVCTISPSSALPLITDPVIIDGYSQPGARANTLSVGDDAVLKIELSGPEALNGLKIEADNSTVQGLVVNNWENGIFLGVDATGNTVRGNFIGTDVTGRVTDPDGIPNNGDELGNLFNGVSIQTGSSNNTIGGTTAAGATSSPATATTAVPTPPTRKAASRSNLPLVMAPTRLRATASSPTPSTTMLGSGSTSITPTTTPGSPATTSLPPG